MTPGLPLWLRAARRTHRGALAFARVMEIFVAEAAVAWVARSKRDAIITAIYDRHIAYAPGGRQHDRQLDPWEREALRRMALPEGARILVGGAGGGREAFALAAEGYDVLAFDPSPELVRRGSAATPAGTTCTLVCASYADLVEGVERGTGPLANPFTDWRPAAIIIGRGSFAHLWDVSQRVPLLRSLRRLAPTAPVLLSYYQESTSLPRSQRLLRQRVFRRATADDAVTFSMHGGFVAGMTEPELKVLAQQAGYRVHYSQPTPTAHAILVSMPDGVADSAQVTRGVTAPLAPDQDPASPGDPFGRRP